MSTPPRRPWWWIVIRWEVFFRWYDLWIGAYVDTKGRAIYICPIPMVGVKVSWRPSEECYP